MLSGESNSAFPQGRSTALSVLLSVDPGVGIEAVVLPQAAADTRVVLDHLQSVGQQSSGFWELGPLVHHLPWKSGKKEERKQFLNITGTCKNGKEWKNVKHKTTNIF